MSEIFREVDEALREDRAKVLWQKYGNIGIAVVTALILGTGGWVYWQDYSESRDQEITGVLLEALDQAESDPTAAIDALAALGEDHPSRQGVLARLHEAALRVEAGDTDGAVGIYRLVADDSGVPDAWRELALLMAVLHSLDTGDPDALATDLRPLTEESSPWRYNARELSGLLALRLGDVDEAQQIFDLLAADPFAPAGIRNRALELSGAAQSR